MMKLSKMTDYAVIVLAEMIKHEEQLMSASVLAENTKLPEPTVSKLLKMLARKNLIESVRGANGGYRLVEAPEHITIANVVEATDGPIRLTSCADQSNDCCDRHDECSMRGKWSPVNQAMNNALESISLSQMIGGRN